MEAPSKELFCRHKLSVSAALVPQRDLCPRGIIRTGESIFTVSQTGPMWNSDFFIYIFYHYRGIDSQIKA